MDEGAVERYGIKWRELLVKLSTLQEPIAVLAPHRHFGIPRKHCSIRMNWLRRIGMLKYADRRKKGYGGYVLTDYGKRKVEEIKSERDKDIS